LTDKLVQSLNVSLHVDLNPLKGG